MNQLLPLMRREWLQHRNGWLWLMGVPFALLLLAVSLPNLQFDIGNATALADPAFPMVVTVTTIIGVTVLNFMIVWITSLFITTGISRRDQGDRSIQFWLSLPTSHSASWAAPLLVHLLLVPAAALAIGMAEGYVLSALLVTRLDSFGAWIAMPWALINAATLSTLARMLAGLPLATLWLLPLILLAVLARAWIGRWGVPVLLLALSLGSAFMERLMGQPLLSQTLLALMANAATSMLPFQVLHFDTHNLGDAASQVAAVPGWVWSTFGEALRDFVTPLFAGTVLVSAACFWGLVEWRQRGAGAASD